MTVTTRFLLAAALLSLGSATHADDLTAQVDNLFARYNHRDTPGCALAVVKDGKIVYKRGYGMADLEYGVRIKPDTIFHVASMSKQFTAFCILLLEADGKLSLDDEARKYLPELPDFGKTITIRQLLQHTSGLRDQWSLLTLAGWRMDDVITEEDILDLVWRQRDLNFEPGSQWQYSNTGYTLAAKIVEKVSGKPLRQFAQERIFGPLGMKRTHFHADYQEVVKDRAYSYEQSGERQYKNSILSYGNVGATSLFTTVEDLARWDQNFYAARVGSQAILARMHETGKLTTGRDLDYALGIMVSEYRGLKTVEHGGADAGFRCTLLRFPDQHFSVILLANVADVDIGGLVRKVADIYLADKLKPVDTVTTGTSSVSRKEIALDPATLDAYVGEYSLFPGMSITVTKENGRLMIQATSQPKTELFATSPTEFFLKAVDAQVTFRQQEQGKYAEAVVHMGGEDIQGKRVQRPVLTTDQMADLAGDYYSAELGVLYTVSVKDGKLKIRYPRGVVDLQPAATGDAFEAPFPISTVRFTRNGAGRVTGFILDAGRVRNVRFTKVELKPVG